MANQHATSVTTAPASLVGNAFVNRYYTTIHQTPHLGYRFYTEESKISRAEPLPETTVEPTTTLSGINDKLVSWDYHAMRTEIITVDSQESLAGRILVMVTGALYDTGGLRRLFVQTFILVPQEKRYYIYNDIFRFLDGGVKSNQHLASEVTTSNSNVCDLSSSTAMERMSKEANALLQPSERSENAVNLDVRTSEYSTSTKQVVVPAVEDYHDELVLQTQVSDTSNSVPAENSTAEHITHQGQAEANASKPNEYPEALVESNVEVPKKSYAYILRLQKETVKVTTPATNTPNASKMISTHAERSLSSGASQAAQSAPQAPSGGRLHPSEYREEMTTAEAEGDGRSVYVKSLPLNVTVAELEQEFSKFGPLKPGGINLRNQRIGVCYAFIDFEEANSVQRATEASPINMNGRQVYIEEKKMLPFRGGKGRLLNQGRGYQNDGIRGRGYYGNGRGMSRGPMDLEREFRGRGMVASRRGYGGGNFNMANTFRRLDTQNGNTFRPTRRASNQMGRNGPLVRNGIMVAAA